MPKVRVAGFSVERYGVTRMFTAPTACACSCVYGGRHPAKYDLSILRVIACAGEPLYPEAWRWARTHLAGNGKWGYVIDNWWQTELGGLAMDTSSAMAMRPDKGYFIGFAVKVFYSMLIENNLML